ncbi:aminotransferase class I/II-fold pyridoxal phosphate-dependent enzyme, partial [Streptomyces sp. DH12]|uniref:aminotransferase class I/II-fold pyridoxal phosphate-dependent enzyme n=1 Tax=Streptomyces sp. DH12 TaxID=2857010 RepID=UPI001E55F658
KERHPGVSYTYGRPLGPHPALLRVLERRLAEAVDPSWDPAGVTVLLVGRGSTDPDANAEVFKAARLLWEGRGYAGVETAFVSLAKPDVPGEREALAGRTDVPGLVVLRSLTKTWGLAGLRIGYVLAAPETVARLERAQPLWPVSTPALAAAEACVSPAALAEAVEAARGIAADRAL